jgi:hypothetical protein
MRAQRNQPVKPGIVVNNFISIYFANGSVDGYFVRHNRIIMKPSLTSTGITLLHELDASGFRAIDMQYDHIVVTGTKGSHVESNKRRRTTQATTKAWEDPKTSETSV